MQKQSAVLKLLFVTSVEIKLEQINKLCNMSKEYSLLSRIIYKKNNKLTKKHNVTVENKVARFLWPIV